MAYENESLSWICLRWLLFFNGGLIAMSPMVESKEKHGKNKHKLYNCPFYTANNHGELVTALVLHSPLQ